MNRLRLAQLAAVLIIAFDTALIVPWMDARPVDKMDPQLAAQYPPPEGAKAYYPQDDGTLRYTLRGTIPQEGATFAPMAFSFLASLGFLMISFLLSLVKRPTDPSSPVI